MTKQHFRIFCRDLYCEDLNLLVSAPLIIYTSWRIYVGLNVDESLLQDSRQPS